MLAGWLAGNSLKIFAFLVFSCDLFISGVVISRYLFIPKTTYTLVGDLYLLPFIMH